MAARAAALLLGEIVRRHARHRAERPSRWSTVEEPFDLAATLQGLDGTCDGILVDCLTLWVSNLLLRGDRDDAILAQAEALAGLLGRRRSSVTLVSNEVGEGVHPDRLAVRSQPVQGRQPVQPIGGREETRIGHAERAEDPPREEVIQRLA